MIGAFAGPVEATGRKAEEIIESAVVERYRAGRLSHRQAGQLLGLDYWQTEDFLRERNVPLNYSSGDLEADCAAQDKILGPL